MDEPEPLDIDLLKTILARFMRVDDITLGQERQSFLVRFRGQLYGDSATVYDQLAQSLRPLDLTPLFRKDGDQHAVLLIPGLPQARPSNPWINVILFILTLLSAIFAGALSSYKGPIPASMSETLLAILRNFPAGIPFAVSLLSILLAHEFGHYLAGRYHHTMVTLPYFIPLPLSPFGTLGAFIQLKEPPKNRRILLDIGIAGPIAGLVVTIPVLFYGLSLSQLNTIEISAGSEIMLEGNSILYLMMKYIVFGQLLPTPQSYGALPPLLYWIRYFFTGLPLPIGGLDVTIHPIAWAGWAGLLVTGLNLIPAGQLDGGHVLYVLMGKRARMLWPFIMFSLIFLGFFWSGWWLWALLIFLLGRLYAEPLDQITSLDPRRKALAIFGLILFILVFIPIPIVQTGL